MAGSNDTMLDDAISHPLFAGMSREMLESILSRVRVLHFAPGDVVYTSGAEAGFVSIITSGVLQIEYPPSGATRGPVTSLVVAPAISGECQVLAERRWSGTGVAVTELSLFGFDRGTWLRFLDEYPLIARRLYLELAGRFLLAIDTWKNQPSLGPAELVARYCHGVSVALARSGLASGRELALNQRDIASATGLTRETVNRTLRAWANDTIVRVKRGRIIVDDVGALAGLAGSTLDSFVKSYWAPAS